MSYSLILNNDLSFKIYIEHNFFKNQQNNSQNLLTSKWTYTIQRLFIRHETIKWWTMKHCWYIIYQPNKNFTYIYFLIGVACTRKHLHNYVNYTKYVQIIYKR
jgi:hypothetical protein